MKIIAQFFKINTTSNGKVEIFRQKGVEIFEKSVEIT